ncbi:MAG: preprotein translocase subunit YajC [Thermotogae bacterium]|nr:MAG: preprotein translocase subunit YajC [Thermotogota bacterium]
MNILLNAPPGTTESAPTASAQATGGSAFSFIFLLIILFVMFYFLIILPQRRREKQFREMVSSLKKGDTVITVGGVVGKVIDIKKDTVKVKSAIATELEITKRAIASVLKEKQETRADSKNVQNKKD